MKKLLIIFAVVVLFIFVSCVNSNTPEGTVSEFYTHMQKNEYREALSLLNLGEDDASDSDEKIDQLVTEMEKNQSDDDMITKFEIISSENVKKGDDEYVKVKTKYYTKSNIDGEEEIFNVYKDKDGQYKITPCFGENK
ncbi:MAG: hypothetical protein LBV69_01395 [Bacteroidales bacterium]|jgi:hypothetical protein|nr:hypothetical protein [Bacteroidales bacterium]